MQLNIFGFEIRKTPEAPALVPENKADGAIEQFTGAGAAHYAHVFDINGRLNDDVAKINRYRQLSHVAEIDSAIEEIVTEAIVVEEEKLPVQVNVVAGDETIPEQIKEAIVEEFKNILALMEFNTEGHDLFRRWYVDGRLYGQMLVDESDLAAGIKDIRFIDPRKIKKVREIQRQKNSAGVDIITGTTEYFAFNDAGINATTNAAIKLSPDNIIYAPSGITDESGETIGYLNKTIKPANMLRYMVYTLARAPERRVFYIDVADIPKQKADQYIRDVMARYKNKVVYNQATGEISDDRIHQCLVMDTKVPLLDGRTLTLTEIANEYKDKELWAYSCDPVTGKFAPGKITWAGVSRPDAEIIRLTLDNGKTIDCTHEHQFPVWGKNLVQAKDLVVGDSMIPLYRKKAQISQANKYGYEQLFDNENKKWVFTHRAVSAWKDANSLENEFVFDPKFIDAEKKTVHHMNCKPLDNSPNNLFRMNNGDHNKWHHANGAIAGSFGGKRAAELGIPQENYAKGRRIFSEMMQDPEFHAKFCEGQKNNWTPEQKERQSGVAKNINLSARGNAAKQELFKTNEKQDQHKQMYATAYSQSMYDAVVSCAKSGMTKDAAAKFMTESSGLLLTFIELNSSKCVSSGQKSFDRFTKYDVVRIAKEYADTTYKELGDQFKYRNHKIVKIEYLSERQDTGCLTIDGNEEFHNYHTFALDAGIYTKNSLLEDYWMPRRSNGRSTEITTLPGSSIMSNMDNVNYFLNKLYAALNVPMSRMKADAGFNLGRTSEITRDEIKFNKFVSRLRRKFSEVFYQALRVQLILKGIIAPEDWQFIKSKINFDFLRDNYFSELKDNEILTGRIQMAEMIQPYMDKYYSHKYVRTMILKQTEEEMEDMDKEREIEMKQHPEWFMPPGMDMGGSPGQSEQQQ
jgi:hypothetical protein